MKSICIKLPDVTKAKLDRKREDGYCMAAYIRRVLAEALRDVKIPPRGRAS